MTNSTTIPSAPTAKPMPLGSFIARKRRLAQFVASQNICVRYDTSVSTGMFNTETGELIMPILDIGEDAHDGLLLHEIAHALFTPNGTAWKDAALRVVEGDVQRIREGAHFLNAIEDPRIERQLKRKFAGASAYLYHLYRWCADNDFFALTKFFAEGKTLADLELIDRINLHFKCGAFMQVPFAASEMPFVRRAAQIETWEEAVALAKELYDLRKRNRNTSDEPQDDGAEPQGAGSQDDGTQTPRPSKVEVEVTEDSTGGSDDASGEGDDASGEGDDASGEDNGDDASGEGDGSEAKATNSSKPIPSESDSDGTVTSYIQSALEEAFAQVARKGGRNLHYCTIPDPTDKFVIPMTTVIAQLRIFGEAVVPQPSKTPLVTVADIARSTYAEWLDENRASVAMLGTEFDLRKAADDHRRTVVCDTGTLDMGRLHAFRTDDDIFLRNELVQSGQSHGMVMLLDMSGSMSSDTLFYESMSQALMLAHFCRRTNLPFRIYGFTTRGGSEPSFACGDFGGEKLRNKVVTLVQDGMKANEFAEVCGLLLVGAYLAEAASRGNLTPKPIVSAQSRHNGALVANAGSAKPAWLNLADTPLNTALLGMLKVCEDFKRSRNLQIVNLVVITDGQPNDSMVKQGNRSTEAYINAKHPFVDSSYGKNRLVPYSVWRDPRSGKEYLVPHHSRSDNSIGEAAGGGDSYEPTPCIETKILLDILRDRIGGKAICLNLVGDYRVDETITHALNPMTDAKGQPICTETGKALRKDAVERWKRNGWSSLKGGGGYDDYLLVRLDLNDHAPVTTYMTATNASDEIIRSRRAKRPLLVRVAELISK
jgi:hypothetical protein